MDVRFSAAKLDLGANPFPSLKTMLDYWNKLRGQRSAPARADFDPSEVIRQLLPRITMVDVNRDPLGFTYRLFGTSVADVYGSDLTGQSVMALKPETFAIEMWRQLTEIVERKAPGLYLYQFPTRSGAWYPHATLTLPFSSDDETVDVVMSINEFGGVKEQLKAFFQDTGHMIAVPAAI